jgi:hypothetical protein
MKSTDIAFTIFIIVVFLGLYVANILAIGIKNLLSISSRRRAILLYNIN